MNSNREELNILLSDFNPDVVCLQETQLKADTNIAFKHYSVYHHAGDDSGSMVHGVATVLVEFSTTSANYAPHQLASSNH